VRVQPSVSGEGTVGRAYETSLEVSGTEAKTPQIIKRVSTLVRYDPKTLNTFNSESPRVEKKKTTECLIIVVGLGRPPVTVQYSGIEFECHRTNVQCHGQLVAV
jgi:hypothetical protein